MLVEPAWQSLIPPRSARVTREIRGQRMSVPSAVMQQLANLTVAMPHSARSLILSEVHNLSAIVLGAELEHQTCIDTTIGPARPMGRRCAVVADSLGVAVLALASGVAWGSTRTPVQKLGRIGELQGPSVRCGLPG